MLQSLITHPNDTSSQSRASISYRKHKYIASKRIELDDIPDVVINKILEFYFLTAERNPNQIRLLKKRIANLALPHSLRTISVSSPEALSRLVLSPQSPLYVLHLGKHVQCFEISYIPRTLEQLDIDERIERSFPNLDIIRFKFTLGVLAASGEALQASICQDALIRSVRLGSDTFLPRLLSQLRPRRFEWISTEPRELYLVNTYPMIRSLFHSWKTLSSVYLEGICLIEQPSLTTWRIFLFADRMHIKGVFSKAGLVLSHGLRRIQDSASCCLLLLEESFPENEDFAATSGLVPLLTYGNTMVSVKFWSSTNRRKLKACVLGRPLVPSSPRQVLASGNDFFHPVGNSVSQWESIDFLFVAGLALIITLRVLQISRPQNEPLSTTHSASLEILWSPWASSFKCFMWTICRDGSYLGERICASESSLWFPDRNFMLRPT